MINKKLLNILHALDSQQVFFGPQGFLVVNSPVALKEAQYGFGKDESGNDLSGSNAGDWQSSWIIIARDTELGDPYFVDASVDELPVYTAFLGEAGWETELVAASLTGFVDCINLLHRNGEQKEAQFVADENTIVAEAQLSELLQQLSKHSACQPFWQMFFRCYQDWLLEDE